MTQAAAIRRIAVLGGGTAGWVAAAALARVLRNRVEIVVIESPDVPIVGVGEATIPPILDFLAMLGVDPAAFIAATGATYKLGIVFQDWRRPGHRYWHPFGTFGVTINGRPFYHHLHRARQEGQSGTVADYNLAAALGDAGRFVEPRTDAGVLRGGLRYALHFDAAQVSLFLRDLATSLGVQRLVATVAGATRTASGDIDQLVLAHGGRVGADLFIDCSGFRSLLLGEALGVPYLDYTRWLPCDRALAAPSQVLAPRPPFTLAAAHAAGWRWQIPLQHRTGNGVVYSSQFMSDAAALAELQAGVSGPLLDQPRQLRFTTGRREVFWRGNCVALGLASGFLEPLESTSIQLAINGVLRLLDHFPDRAFGPHNVAAYNRHMIAEFDAVRDFIILHYWLSERRDSPFWRYCAEMDVPPSLAARVALYREGGRIVPQPFEMFTDLSWFYVLDGLGVQPAAFDPIAALPAAADLARVFDRISRDVAQIVAAAPPHDRCFTRAEAA
jgi:tryptophan halogenase